MAGEPQTPHSRLSPRLERDIQRINNMAVAVVGALAQVDEYAILGVNQVDGRLRGQAGARLA